MKPIILSIFLGALLAFLFNPLNKLLQRRISSKFLPPLLVSLVVLLIFIIPGAFLLTVLAEQSYTLFLIGKQRLSTGLFEQCASQFCADAREIVQNLSRTLQLQEILKTVTAWIIQKGSAVLVSIPAFLVKVFIVFLSLFYFLKDGPEFVEKLGRLLHFGEDRYLLVMNRLKEIVHGLVFGYLMVAAIQGALGTLGFFILGVPLSLLWGVIMAFLALIPALGTGIIWFPASVILFLDGFFQGSNSLMLKGGILFVYGLMVISSIDNFLKPKLVSRKAKIHPLIIFLGIFGGLFFFGMWGVILGPLILSVTTVLIDVFILSRSDKL